jgi:glutathione synthase/RimK-type ligase-like ATP-grasp enzyme
MTDRRPPILLVTETADLAADLLVLAAGDRGIPFIRFNQDEFPQRAAISWQSDGQTRFCCDGRAYTESDVSGAWFRRMPSPKTNHDPTAAFVARETEGFLGGVWDTAPWFWMNPPAAAARAEHKLLQLRHARRLGFMIPPTLATNCPDAAVRFVDHAPAIAKALVGGRVAIDGVDHAVFTSAVTAEDLTEHDEILACPAIFQPRVETRFDLRVTVVGDQIFPARIVLRDRTDQDLDWRRADPARLIYEPHILPADLALKCTKLVATLGLAYGALDFVVTPNDEHVFLELNPAGQWGWIERALGLPITDAILDKLTEASPCA